MTIVDSLRSFVRSALFDNAGLKVVSLICALGFYVFIHGAENAQRTYRVGVMVIPPEDANRRLMTQLPTEIAVTLRGSPQTLDDLRADDLGSLQLDLRSGQKTRIDLDPSTLRVPPSLTVEEIYPTRLDLRWDDVVSRPIRVQIARTGEPSPGFSVKREPRVEPELVTARGPRSVVDVIQFARAAPFDVSGLVEGEYRRPLALDKPPDLVSFDLESVSATIEITRQLANKQFPALKVEVIGFPRATTVPKTVSVVVNGMAEDIALLTAETVIARVEPKPDQADKTRPGSAFLDVLVDVPRKTHDGPPPEVEIIPPKVLVKW